MSWADKIEQSRASASTNERLMLVFDTAPGVSADFLNELQALAPFVPESYLQFLGITDGAQIDFFVLYGSGRSQFPGLIKSNASWSSIIDPRTQLVIGSDPSGSAFVLQEDGAIYLLGTDPPDLARARWIASDFDDLLQNVLMGERYLSLYPSGTYEDNDWLRFLQSQNWISQT